MKFNVITLFPERYRHYLEYGLPQKAFQKGLFQVRTVYLPDFADTSRSGRIDDVPYGGGPGMVVQVGPVERALEALDEKHPVVLLTPRGRVFRQSLAREFSKMEGLTLICGYYEGVDERISEHLVDYRISLGDFILGSGDLAALCLIEAITRLLPGYMGAGESLDVETDEGFIEYPQYTRPADYKGWLVPDVLLSGHHSRIAEWRQSQSERLLDEKKRQ